MIMMIMIMIVLKADCCALAEACALLSPVLVVAVTEITVNGKIMNQRTLSLTVIKNVQLKLGLTNSN